MIPKYITVHCSATSPDMPVDAPLIRKWHKAKGWSDIGYHYVITRDGSIQEGRPLTRSGAHVQGHNQANVGICLVGGVDSDDEPKDNFTEEQFGSLRYLITELVGKYGIPLKRVKGHRDWGANKACPCFDIKTKLKEWE